MVPGKYRVTDSNNGAIEECDDGYYSEEGDRGCNACNAPMVCSNPALPEGMQTDCAQMRGYYQHNDL
jgi:hypothetical protein